MNTETLYEIPVGFTELWWNDLVEKTQNLQQNVVVKEALSETKIAQLSNTISDCIKKAFKDDKNQDYLGIWKNGKQLLKQIDFLKENPINENETIESWRSRVFKETKLTLFLNHLESHSETGANLLLELIEPYVSKHGIPVNGISTTVVVGDYKWNPLGVHKGTNGGYALHLNLSDTIKEIYTWDDDKIKELGFDGETTTENFDDFINNYSSKYTFQAGDICAMTSKDAHIEKVTGFSIGLIIDFNRLTEKELVEKLWFKLSDQLFHKNFTGDKATILPSYEESNHEEYIKQLFKGVRHRNIETRQTIEDALSITYLDHKLSLASNRGLQNAPVVNNEFTLNEFKKVIVNTSLLPIKGFKILCYEELEFLFLFVRGRKLKIKKHQDIITFITLLNKEEGAMTYSTIKETIFKQWADDSIFMLLHLLFKNKGIKIQTSK